MNEQLKRECMKVAIRWDRYDISSEDEAIDELREVVEDYASSHPRQCIDTTQWDYKEVLNNLICNEDI